MPEFVCLGQVFGHWVSVRVMHELFCLGLWPLRTFVCVGVGGVWGTPLFHTSFVVIFACVQMIDLWSTSSHVRGERKRDRFTWLRG